MLDSQEDQSTERTDPSKGIAFCIGVNSYKCLEKLNAATADAERIYHELTAGENALFASPESAPLLDPTHAQLQKFLARAYGTIESDARVLLYYAGHGTVIGDDLYLCPKDTERMRNGCINPFSAFHLSYVLAALLGEGKPQSVIVVIDACHAGAASRYPWDQSLLQKCIEKEGVTVVCLSACTREQTAAETQEGDLRYGAFTGALLRAIEQGKGGGGASAELTADDVWEMTKRDLKKNGYQQMPVRSGSQAVHIPIARNCKYERVETFNPGYVEVLQALDRQKGKTGKFNEILKHGPYTIASKPSYGPWGLIKKIGKGVGRLTSRGQKFLAGDLAIPKRIRGRGDRWEPHERAMVKWVDGKLMEFVPGNPLPEQLNCLASQHRLPEL